MKIDYFEYLPPKEKKPTLLGLNIQQKFGLTHVNLFSLGENEGAPISKNLWRIAKQITTDIFQGKSAQEFSWTLTSKGTTTALHFYELGGRPFKIDIANLVTIHQDNNQISKERTLDELCKNFIESGEEDIKGGISLPWLPTTNPVCVFTIPCEHPDASDGVFHCDVPKYQGSGFKYILADTRKAISHLRENNHALLEHGRRGSKERVGFWLDSFSLENPANTGGWDFIKGQGLDLAFGNASIVRLMAELELPYFPMTISDSFNNLPVQVIEDMIGYNSKTKIDPNPTFGL